MEQKFGLLNPAAFDRHGQGKRLRAIYEPSTEREGNSSPLLPRWVKGFPGPWLATMY